ncbi:MAG: hypothetical protein ACM37W_27570 [Actinomycetota bacterium]
MSFFVLGKKAEAGAGEPVELVPAEQESQQPKNVNATAKFKWDKWSEPYWLNTQVCRDKAGETACFSSETARKLGWSIPARN